MAECHPDRSLVRAAELLAAEVRCLLDHDDAIVKALAKSLGKAEARSRLRQLEVLVEALEIEVWHSGDSPDRTVVASIAKALKRGAIVIGGLVGATLVPLVTTDVYHDLAAIKSRADEVIECVVIVEKIEEIKTMDGGDDHRLSGHSRCEARHDRSFRPLRRRSLALT